MKKEQPGINDDHQRKLLDNLDPGNHDAVITWIENIHGVAARGGVSKAFMNEAAKKLNTFLPKGYNATLSTFFKKGSKEDKYKLLVRMGAQILRLYSPGSIYLDIQKSMYSKKVQKYRQS